MEDREMEREYLRELREEARQTAKYGKPCPQCGKGRVAPGKVCNRCADQNERGC